MAFKIRIGTRPSRLALAQVALIERRLKQAAPGVAIEIVEIRTSGDKLARASLAQVGGKGLFIKELEQALAAGKIDIAVHSMKDLPSLLPDGFAIAAVPERGDARDTLVSRGGVDLKSLPAGARVGTDRALVEATLAQTGYNIAAAARELGISRLTLYRLLNRLRIRIRPDREALARES